MTVLVTLLQPNQQGLPDRAEYLAQRQPVSQKLNLMRTLQRNFKTCVKAAQKNKDPSERERHEEPETPTSNDPKGWSDKDPTVHGLDFEFSERLGRIYPRNGRNNVTLFASAA